MKKFKQYFTIGVASLALAGCGATAMVQAKLPDGETNLSCAAMIYAASSLVDDEGVAAGASTSDYIAVMTKYGTAHAQAKGIGSDEIFNVIKLEAMAMTGKVGNRSVVASDGSVVKRAKACFGS